VVKVIVWLGERRVVWSGPASVLCRVQPARLCWVGFVRCAMALLRRGGQAEEVAVEAWGISISHPEHGEALLGAWCDALGSFGLPVVTIAIGPDGVSFCLSDGEADILDMLAGVGAGETVEGACEWPVGAAVH
jgi:hypothetical protein